MIIKCRDYEGVPWIKNTIADYTASKLTVESIEKSVYTIAQAFGRLLDTLAVKGILTGDEITEVVESYYKPSEVILTDKEG